MPRINTSVFFADPILTISLDGINLAPANARETLASLNEVASRFNAVPDSRAIFADIYSVVTRSLRDSVEGRRQPKFLDPQWMSRLSGRFGALYFTHVARSLQGLVSDSQAWKIAFKEGARRHVPPFQHVLLGMNAHINFDLPLGIESHIRQNGGYDPAKLALYKRDYDTFNTLLENCIPELMLLLAQSYGCKTTRLILKTPKAKEAVIKHMLKTLGTWRDQVWADMVALLRSNTPAERKRIHRRIDERSAKIARALASPSLPHGIEKAVLSADPTMQLRRTAGRPSLPGLTPSA